MKRLALLVVLSLMLLVNVQAQDKELTIEQAVIGVWRELHPEMVLNPQFRPDTKEFTKVSNDYKSIVVASFDLKKTDTLLTLSAVNQALKADGKPECRHLYDYEWVDKNKICIHAGNSFHYFNPKDKSLIYSILAPDTAENVDKCEAASMLAYTIGNNLYVVDNQGVETAVSDEANAGIVYGQTVHRSEFGISKGTFWSPQGHRLAFYRKDETMVTDYPIVNVDTRVAELQNIKYCMAGMTSEQVTVGIYNVATKAVVYLQTGEPKDQYLTNLAWSPDEKYVYLIVLNRAQNHACLNMYDASDGSFVKTLFEERDDKYVEPLYPIVFLPNDASKFIYRTRKDGFMHLYLYDTDGNELRRVTSGAFEVQEFYGFADGGKDVIIRANKRRPIDFDLYRVNISTGAMLRISSVPGSHNAVVSGDGNYLIDSYSSTTIPGACVLMSTKGRKINDLLVAANPLADFKLGRMTIGTLKADDNETDLYYRLLLPPDFDSTKKYPAIVYVYGGPHARMIENAWLGGASGWDWYMAQKGYVMFTLDNRGSADRGLKFENIIHRQLGTVETQDQLLGVEFLRRLGYVDTTRLGVHGWSYGGFMTTTLMTDCADVFKVGVAGGPVINWEFYEIMYGERYMDMPQENSDGYAKSNLLNKVDKLKGRLMLIHGTSDPVVVWQHSLRFIKECVKKNVLVDYFVYPGHEHNVRGIDRVHLMRTVTRYFDDNL